MRANEYQDIGHYLRDSRESLRISLDDAASALHIRAKYLRAIESGNLGDLPGKAYTRGYIKNYVEFLDLNPDEALAAYESLLTQNKGREFFVPEPTLRENLPTRRILWWSLAGIFGLYLYWYIALHEAAAPPPPVADIPYEFMQVLDKTPHAAMDANWQNCLAKGRFPCFIALHTPAVTEHPRSLYDIRVPEAKPASEPEPESEDAPQEP